MCWSGDTPEAQVRFGSTIGGAIFVSGYIVVGTRDVLRPLARERGARPRLMMTCTILQLNSLRQPGYGQRLVSWSTPTGELGGLVYPTPITLAQSTEPMLIGGGSERDQRNALAVIAEHELREAGVLGFRPSRVMSGAGTEKGGRIQ